MSKLLKIGIAGCGAIGSALAKTIVKDFAGRAQLTGLYDTGKEKVDKLAGRLNKQKLAVFNLDKLISRSDLVIESARADSAFDIARKTILSSRDIMVMSVGGIIGHYKELSALAGKKGCRIFIPSGAVCGIDGLKAAALNKIRKVTLTTKKPPRALGLGNLAKETVIFEGDALSAIKLFPQNINVAVTLSLAGIGAKKTLVRIVASPEATENIHEVEIDYAAGKIFTRTENMPHPDNPKTSYLAVLSAIATLQQILEPIKIGT